jgi:uncharacterized membrane protein
MGEFSLFQYMAFFLRWVHIMSGITWIGLLYFFNFVNVPFQGVLEKELKSKVNPPLLLRALWWFRWSAMFTMVVGWFLLLYKYSEMHLWYGPEGDLSAMACWIFLGGILGTIMWFNVWFIIWPCQKKIIGFMKAGQTDPSTPALAKKALLFSRTNAYLSGPMLFSMIAPNHFGTFGIVPVIAVFVIGMGTIWGLIKISAKAGQ